MSQTLKPNLEQLVDYVQNLTFGTPILITPDGDITEPSVNILDENNHWVYSVTTCELFTHNIELLVNEIPIHKTNWIALTHMSNQSGYSGPILHESEQISVGIIQKLINIARDLNKPTLFVISPVLNDTEDNYVGWCILRHKFA